jgi:predicted HicB family RNase H-like nuclease
VKNSCENIVRIPSALHKKAALQAAARGESLNQFVAEALAGV